MTGGVGIAAGPADPGADMAGAERTLRKKRTAKRRLAQLFERLRSELTWKDLVVGFLGAVFIAFMVQGYRFQTLPQYRVGDIAEEDVRADQDVAYEDPQATDLLRRSAEERTPAVYGLDDIWIADQEKRISQTFALARQVLVDHQVPENAPLSRGLQNRLLPLLQKEIQGTIPDEFLPLLLDQRFDLSLESRILRVLDDVLRNGIVADPDAFQQDLRRGVIVRMRSSAFERALGDASRVRTQQAAREYLRQVHLEFAELPAPARARLLELLDTFLAPTLVYDARETDSRRAAAAARVPPSEIQIKKGKIIIRAGEEVTARTVGDLEALRSLRKPRPIAGQLAGLFVFAAGLLYALWRYFLYYRRRYRRMRNCALLVLILLVLAVIMTRLLTFLADLVREQVASLGLQTTFDLYAVIPFAFCALLATLLIDLSAGLMTAMAVAALTGLFYGDVYASVYALLGSLAAVYGAKEYRERAAIFRAGLAVSLVNCCALLGIHMAMQEAVSPMDLVYVGILGTTGGVLSSALSATLLPVMESVFRITTDIRLLELSNLNFPALRRLSVEVPGTYHHSLMVGALAEAAAQAIGANPLLVQVGAYYHDLGKMLHPEYFTENQPAHNNRHESLTPSMSCLVISRHVKDGIDLAREAGLPEAVRDMIPQHHGTRVMKYFYEKAKEMRGEGDPEINQDDFRYPGPKPQCREAAILMMADSIEAASRTLAKPTPAQIRGLIDRLVGDVLAEDQLDECDLTLHEIRLVKESFFKVISRMHHQRISYPGYDFQES